MIAEARNLFDFAPEKLSEDVAAHFRRQRDARDDGSKLLDPPPQFSSVHRVQTRHQSLLQRSHVTIFYIKLMLTLESRCLTGRCPMMSLTLFRCPVQ